MLNYGFGVAHCREGRVRFPQFIVVTILALTCSIAPACAEKRVALVIGNGAYLHADKLANPVSDARGMREALAALKFDVVYGEDLDLKALRRLISRFNDRVENADVALVYFAGHGATFSDVPYVVPVDAEFASLTEMPAELVGVEELIGDMRRAKSLRIAILDACRDNAAEQALKKSRGGPASRGLAPPKNPTGLIITYATQPGATAADSAGSGNSPFTAALLANIAAPGIDVKDMFFKVGSDVIAATGGRQRPEISISMYEPYNLVTAPTSGGSAAVTAPPGAGARGTEAAAVWRDIQNTTNLAVVEDFILHYGNAPVYGALARAKREELVKSQVALAVAPAQPPGAAPLTAERERGLQPKQTFRECADCPEMVVVPAGSFTMGTPDDEPGGVPTEIPQHVVSIRRSFAVGKFHVTVDQFGAFVRETGYDAKSRCSWRNPGFAQDGSHPVVCMSWDDAKAYVDWLAQKTGKPYRLLSEAEFEYAARGQTSPGGHRLFWFGDNQKDLCRYGNSADQKASNIVHTSDLAPCDDGYAYTSPAGSYLPNAFGLYDMAGNAWQWTADCWHDTYARAPSDGSAWTRDCQKSDHILRGSSWYDGWSFFKAANRWTALTIDGRFDGHHIGFRVARTLAR
jgi:formylglycine-generating enzyme required for sulfatase activity